MLTRRQVLISVALALMPAPASAQAGAPPSGYYECYFSGAYGLQNSSITEVTVLESGRYRALGEVGRFQFEPRSMSLRMVDGALAGRVARTRESSGRPAIVFIRKENEVGGKPTIDISDTWCYYKPRS